MKATWMKAISAGVLFSAGAYALTASAMHHGEEGMHQRGEHMAKLLDLNEQQRGLFEAMRAEHMPKQDRKARLDMRKELITLAQQDNFDAGKAQRMAAEIGREASQLAYRHAEAYHAFYSSLSEEQRTKFTALHEARAERWKDKMERREEGRKSKHEHGDEHRGKHHHGDDD